tara:strand:+ start:895 stop:1956 length:1062 start_codon:yes stop_codon:yes gene_type:complete
MTNIGALKVVENKKKGKPKEHLVFVADGMSSETERTFSKVDNTQKLVRTGDHLIMGTGPDRYCIEVQTQLQDSNLKTSEEVAKAILQITDQFKLTPMEGLNFIVGGPDTEGLQIYHVNTTGFMFGPDGKPDPRAQYKDRGYTKKREIFDGSGSRFVNSYIDGIQEAGKVIFTRDIADGLVLAYEFGKKGARSLSVNDQLQLGIISHNGVSRVYPKDVSAFNRKAGVEYIEEMTGIKLENPGEEPNFEKRRDMCVIEREISDLLESVYYSLDCDLSTFAGTRLNFTRNAEAWGNKYVPEKQLKYARAIRIAAKQNVLKGANAMITRSLDALLDYQHDFEARQHAKEDRVRAYQK